MSFLAASATIANGAAIEAFTYCVHGAAIATFFASREVDSGYAFGSGTISAELPKRAGNAAENVKRVLVVFRLSDPFEIFGAVIVAHTVLVVNNKAKIESLAERSGNKTMHVVALLTAKVHLQIASRATYKRLHIPTRHAPGICFRPTG
ncbi:hypothetical protein LZM47_29610 [Pseudomonas aeruginosa]|nr:hypothetical protein [Pseudomonas aeruginosa]MCT5924341.1 hypothetical protein [Pseudomonas aeruginosa]